MNTTKPCHRFIAILLSVLMVLGMMPTIAFAADPTQAAAALADDINNYTGGAGASGSLKATADGDTVTITGSITEASMALVLGVSSDVTVVWDATLIASNSTAVTLIQNSSSSSTFEVVGGEISTDGVSTDIFNSIGDWDISVAGGTISAEAGMAIYTAGTNSTVEVSGGLVYNTATRENAPVIFVNSTSATIENVVISGTAVVEARGNSGIAIQSYGDVRVTGGTVSATTGKAIRGLDLASAVTVSGGLVFAYGNADIGSSDVIHLPYSPSGFTGATGDGMVIAWNQAANTTDYEAGTITDISKSPLDSAAFWSNNSGSGIAYSNGTNIGLIELPVTVSASGWEVIQDAIDNANDGDVIDLSVLTTPENGRICTFVVGDDKTITIKGNGTQIENVAFVFGSNNNITIEDLNLIPAYNHVDNVTSEPGLSTLHFAGTDNTLTLSGSNIITGGGSTPIMGYGAALGVPYGASLTIGGTGTLTAKGGRFGAGIGGGSESSGGNISIVGGTITSNGNYAAAGIGGGWNGNGGTVVITGGSVKAAGEGGNSEAIGKGRNGDSSGTLTDGNGNNVYLNTFTINGYPNTDITAADYGENIVYGTDGVKTDDNNRLYFYLPISASTDYVYATANSIEYAGLYSATANHSYTHTMGISVRPADISLDGSFVYTGSEISPGVTASLEDQVLNALFYTVSYSGNRIDANSADATVIITGRNGYRGIAKKVFNITKATPTVSDLSYDIPIEHIYNNTAQGIVSVTGIAGLGAITVKYNGDTTAPTAAGTYTVTADIAESANYNVAAGLDLGSYTIAAKMPTASDLTATIPDNHVYNGAVQGVDSVTGPAGVGTITVKYDGSETVPADAGTYAITVELSGGSDYEATTISLGNYTIAKAELTIAGGTVSSKVYDGLAAADITAVTFDGVASSDTLELTEDYIISDPLFDNANTGSGKIVTATVTLIADGLFAKNYTLANGSLSIDSGSISQAIVTSIDTSISAVTKTAYEVRDITSIEGILALATLPDEVTVTTDGGITTLPITWAAAESFDAKGITYNVTGTLTGNANISANDVTSSITIDITPVYAPDISLSNAFIIQSTSSAATAAELGNSILLESGSVTVSGESIAYTIAWDGGETLDRRNAGNVQTFTGTVTYTSAPAWLSVVSPSAAIKVTVTAKAQAAISGITVSNKVYDGEACAAAGTVVIDTGAVDVDQLVWKWESTDGGNYDSTSAPTNAGDYKLVISVPENHPTHVGNADFHFSITKQPVTVKADDQSITQNAGLPAFTYTVVGEISGEPALVGTPTLSSTATDSANVGAFPIEVDMSGVSGYTDNYMAASPAFESGTLTVNAAPPAGGLPNSDSTLKDKEYAPKPGEDVVVVIDIKGNTILDVKNGDKVLERGKDYIVDGDKIILKSEYLDSLEQGEYIITVDMNRGADPQFKLIIGARDWENPFADVSESDWFYDDVEFMVKSGLFNGTSDTTFDPHMPMNRGMIVTVLWRMSGEPEPKGINGYTDVEEGMYYEKAITWATEEGVVRGIGEDKFEPKRAATRQELAQIIAYYARDVGFKLPVDGEAGTYSDSDSIAELYMDSVMAMRQSGIMIGVSGNMFCPRRWATRAEVAAVFARYIRLTLAG